MYLGLDLGTTNVKALVVDDGGRVVASGKTPIGRFCTPDGGVEQDIEQIWKAVEVSIKRAVQDIDSTHIQAIGVSSQGGAIQVFNVHDEPQGRVISWLDTRGQPYDKEFTAELGSDFFVQHIGYGASGVAIGQILRLRHQTPDLIRAPNRIGFVGDAVVGRLCGRRAHDATSLAIAMLYNPWRRRPDIEVMNYLGLYEEQLPCVLPAAATAGTLRKSVAESVGLRQGIPVSAAIHDQYAASIGAASVGEGDITFSAGTAWVLLANTDTLKPPVAKEACICPHPVDGLYGQMLSMTNGGSAIQWVIGVVGRRPLTPKQVDNVIASVEPGCNGLRFWPFLSAGPNIDRFDRMGGCLSGIRLSHSRNHLIRAAVEGLACELGRHIRLFNKAGCAIGRLIMCGSSATGCNVPQLIADIVNLPVSCVDAPDVSAFGAAVIARKLVDTETDLAEIARRWTPAYRTLCPGEHTTQYRDLFRDYFALLDSSVPHISK